MLYLIVQPYTDKRDRLLTAMVVRSFDTVAEAFAELDRLRSRLEHYRIPKADVELIVVDEQRRRVTPSGEPLH